MEDMQDLNRLIKNYSEEYYKMRLRFKPLSYKPLLDFAKLKSKNLLVLDAGCGIGPGLKLLMNEGHDPVGIDFRVYPLLIAKEKLRVPLICASVEYLPFRNEVFDVILMKDIIEHLHKPRRTLRESYRVLKRGGVLVLTTPNYMELRRLIYSIRRKTLEDFIKPTHLYFYTPLTLKRLIKAAGFKRIRVKAKGSLYIPLLGHFTLGRRFLKSLGAVPFLSYLSNTLLVGSYKGKFP